MKIDYLKQQWTDLTTKYSTSSSTIDKLWSEIEKEYSTKNRHYHNLNHIYYMMRKAETLHDMIEDCDTLYFSIFYHDVVYNSKRSDNEEKSADLAVERLAMLSVPVEQQRKVYQQIIATKAHAECDDNDTRYLIDIDLAILGESKEIYQIYTRQVRKEYSIYPDFLYKPGRKKVLKQILSMTNIYKSEVFISQYEDKARENMRNELASL